MTRDEITRMAQEADCPIGPQMFKFYERFAALVAAAEREACAKVCEQDENRADDWIPDSRPGGYFANAIRARGQA